MDFFINECKKNTNNFDLYTDVIPLLTENYPVIVMSSYLGDIYAFKKPTSEDQSSSDPFDLSDSFESSS
jgi:hypothetical protein